jgi:D-alanyl-D-alanine carboxypeptidase/D-alanyl-D-alanine-endopeptidase (penicillin-binding protein 4)
MTGVDLPAMLHLSPSSSSISSVFRSRLPLLRQGLAAALLAAALPGVASAQADAPVAPASLSTKAARESRLPPAVEAALARAKLPRDAVSALVVEVDGRAAPRLDWQSHVAMNPASVMKLVTTYAALDQLGPAHVWRTPDLRGPLYIQGQGDPKLVMERLWLMLRRLQGMGIRLIVGDIVLDRSAFSVPSHDPSTFDNEPWRPYNVAPDALLVNFKAVTVGFSPDAAAGVARLQYDPPLAGIQQQETVPLAPAGSECGDWRARLQLDMADPLRIAFAGPYPASCGDKSWSLAPAQPEAFAGRAIEGMWRELGGKLTGTVRDGRVPAGLQPAFQSESPSLAEVVRDINKYRTTAQA